MIEVKLCPICGEPAIIEGTDNSFWWKHKCDHAFLFESSYVYNEKEDAIEEWNKYVDMLETYGEAMYNG
jgi:hypothetical protein